MSRLPKAEPIKEVLAWWLRSRTTVSCPWIRQRLRMGHELHVRCEPRDAWPRRAGGRWALGSANCDDRLQGNTEKRPRIGWIMAIRKVSGLTLLRPSLSL